MQSSPNYDHSDNPYAPAPSGGAHTVKPDARGVVLHPIHGIVWAGVLSSFVGAGIVLAINYARLGRAGAAGATVVGSLFAFALLVTALLTIPALDALPDIVVWIPQLFAIYGIARGLQGEAIQDHQRNGGRIASAWWSVGIAALLLPVLLAVIFGLAIAVEPGFGEVLTVENDEVYYDGEATRADAQQLADVLQQEGYFNGDGVSVRVEAAGGEYVVSFVVLESAWSDPLAEMGFREIGSSIIGAGFPAPLTIQLCDDFFESQKTIVVEQ